MIRGTASIVKIAMTIYTKHAPNAVMTFAEMVCYHNDEPYCQNCYDEINDSIMHITITNLIRYFYGKDNRITA